MESTDLLTINRGFPRDLAVHRAAATEHPLPGPHRRHPMPEVEAFTRSGQAERIVQRTVTTTARNQT
jgi:hypothetical protein